MVSMIQSELDIKLFLRFLVKDYVVFLFCSTYFVGMFLA